jgi:glutamate-1-semialdehyde 2,1-aminomutase
MLQERMIFQPMPLKRLYISASHDRAVLDRSLGLIEDILKSLAGSQGAARAAAAGRSTAVPT